MRIGICVVLGAALIAVSIAWVERWRISATPHVVYRIDGWSGKVKACVMPMDALSAAAAGESYDLVCGGKGSR